MAISTTGIMKDQLMREPLDTTPEAGMEGGVNRPSIVGDLMEAMRDLDFRQLMEQYAAMTGQNVATSRPLTNQMMKEEIPTISNMPVLPGAPIVPGAPEGSQVYSNMPVQQNNFNNAPGVDDVMRQNLGLMQPQPLEV
jgi:hypothetical protein